MTGVTMLPGHFHSDAVLGTHDELFCIQQIHPRAKLSGPGRRGVSVRAGSSFRQAFSLDRRADELVELESPFHVRCKVPGSTLAVSEFSATCSFFPGVGFFPVVAPHEI